MICFSNQKSIKSVPNNITSAPEEMEKTAYKYLSILSLLIVPRVVMTKVIYDIAANFAKEDGWIPYSISTIAIAIVSIIIIVLVYLSARFLDTIVYDKYSASPDKAATYMWFNRIFICIPVIVAIISGLFVLYNSIILESDLDDWDGITEDSTLKKNFRLYYLTTLQKIAVSILIVVLVLFLIFCIICIIKSPLLENGTISSFATMSQLKATLSPYLKGLIFLSLLGLLSFGILGLLGLLGSLGGLFNNKLLGQIFGAIALAIALGILAALAFKFLSALLAGLLGLFGKSSKNNNSSSSEGV